MLTNLIEWTILKQLLDPGFDILDPGFDILDPGFFMKPLENGWNKISVTIRQDWTRLGQRARALPLLWLHVVFLYFTWIYPS